MQSGSTRRVFLATAVLCCCVAALAVAGMANEPTKDAADKPVLIATNVNTNGWAETPQQPATDLEKKKTYQVAPIAEETMEAKGLDLGEAGLASPIEDAAPFALDSAAQNPGLESEPNDTAPTANSLGGGNVVVMGNLFPNGDVDFWSFNGNAGDKVYAATQTAFSANASADSQLRLIAPDGTTVIEFDDDDGSITSLSSTIAGATLPAAGTYYLRLNHFSATTQLRPYYLHFRLQPGAPTPEVEPNDTPGTANPLPANGWVGGVRNPAIATEQDWFSFAANAGDTVFLSLDLDPERDSVTWNGRLGIALFGDAGNQILVVDDSGTLSATNLFTSEALFMTVKNAGTYYAFVDSASAAVGGPTATYQLSVSVHPATPVGVNCTTYNSGAVGLAIGPGAVTTDSTIAVPGNPRIEDVNVSITLNHAIMNQIDAALLSPAGNENSLFTDVGASVAGGQTQMDTDIDDEAGIPTSTFTVFRGLGFQPELNYRLGWLKGEDGGGLWTLRLRDDIADVNGGTLASWSITICEPAPPPVCGGTSVLVYASDFEAGDAGFTHSGVVDQWARGLPGSAPITNCASGTNCWKTNLVGNYAASSNQDLLSPPLSLAGLTSPIQVTWAQKYQMEVSQNDSMVAQIREPGPINIRNLFLWQDATMTDTVGSPAVAINESAGWGVQRRRIDEYANKTVQLRWNITTNASTQLSGLAVDDVRVTACCTAASCDDGNPCTDDVCTSSGCTHVNNTAPCSDGNPCTAPDVCGGGSCQPGPNPCDDGNACTQDVCDGVGGCTYPPVICPPDGNPCTDDVCNPGTGCGFVNNTSPCSDGNVCTSADTCAGGACVGTNNTDPCSDGNVCTMGDVCAGGVCVPGPTPSFNQTYCSAAGGTINDSAVPPTLATPYPSTIAVAGPTVVCGTRVRLTGLNHTFPDDLDLLLAGPTGANAIIMSDVGGSADAVGLTLVLDDAAAAVLPDGGPLVSGAFRPTNVNPGTGTEAWPAPAPAPGGGSALSVFSGTNPNGNWNLFLVDDQSGDFGTFGAWCLELATICGVDADCNDGNPCTDDACVAGSCQHPNNSAPCDDGNACTSNDTCSGGSCVGTPNTDPCDDGLLCTTDDACSGGACTGTPVNCDDSNACTADACDPGTGACTHDPISCNDDNGCTADYCDPPTGCGHQNQCVEFCNTDGITIVDSATPPTKANPYPSDITVSGVYGSFFLGGVKLNGITHTFPDDIDVLLVSPAGLDAKILSDAGGSGDVAGVNLLLTDGASSSIPDGGPLVSGNFKPTDINDGADTFPAPAPVPSGAVPLSTFNLSNPNGTWSLYLVDDANVDAGTMTGWCLEVLATCVADADCDDGSVCTTDSCVNSHCQNTPISCDDSNACTADSCDPVTGCRNDAIVCDDTNVCTTDTCNPASGCVFTNNANPCDDGDACTSGDVCAGGACSGTPIGSPGEVTGVVFADKSTINWSPTAFATSWDGVRGLVSALPVGPGGGDEGCAGGLGAPTVSDASIPALSQSYWYLFRGANACAPAGSWGNATSGPRVTTTCP